MHTHKSDSKNLCLSVFSSSSSQTWAIKIFNNRFSVKNKSNFLKLQGTVSWNSVISEQFPWIGSSHSLSDSCSQYIWKSFCFGGGNNNLNNYM
jgi:hypothetical protein